MSDEILSHSGRLQAKVQLPIEEYGTYLVRLPEEISRVKSEELEYSVFPSLVPIARAALVISDMARSNGDANYVRHSRFMALRGDKDPKEGVRGVER